MDAPGRGCVTRAHNRDQVAEVVPYRAEILIFRGGAPKFLTEFLTDSDPPTNMWQSLVTIGQATSEIKRRKKKKEDLNYTVFRKKNTHSHFLLYLPGKCLDLYILNIP